MEPSYVQLVRPDVRQMLLEDDRPALTAFCETLNPTLVAEVLAGMDSRDAWRVLSACSVERQAEIFEFLTLPQQIELVAVIDRKPLSKLIETMAPDDRVDLLERLDPDKVEDLLPLIAQAERSDIRKLLSYPEGSAGSIMTTDYASLPAGIRVGEALHRLRQQAPDSETIYYVYITDEQRHLTGVITLRDLILARPDTQLGELVERDFVAVQVDEDQEFAAQQLARYDLIAIPVVDAENRLVGIITHDDVLDVLQEAASEDAYRLSAVEPLEDDYLSTPIPTIVWKRGIWLMVLSVMALGTATVLNYYEGTSQGNNWMIWFLPLVLASGGNTGSQSATLVIRALALQRLKWRERVHMVGREFVIGLALGSGLAVFDFLAAYTLFGIGFRESLTIACTVGLVVGMGTITGSMLPLIFKTIGMDPALMSNPLIAALSDVLGVVIYYSVALILLGQIAP